MKTWMRRLIGPPRDVTDHSAMHKLSLVALLAWVGLGADGLSSSAYGPDEAYRALGEHRGLAALLAIATALTVFIISYGYSRIIEQFPAGGGGYVVASRLLGEKVGVVSGAALLVDYVLTITISIAAGADAIFSFLPPGWVMAKLPITFVALLLLTILNLRGVKESVMALLPVFILFLVTHGIALAAAIGVHLTDVPRVTGEVSKSIGGTVETLGWVGALGLFVRAYSMGGGTYTGIEAVSNGVAMMREPRVRTAQRTMVLMATSLAITAGGILLSYLLLEARPAEGKTMNAVMLELLTRDWTIGGWHFGHTFVIGTLVTEGALLFVAAQAGFLDGPRVMASMAGDGWLPRRFAALSDRLSMQNGILLMAVAAAAALLYTKGHVGKLVVMYSINVFLTFSLSNLAMLRFWWKHRAEHRDWKRHLPAHLAGLLLCLTILVITVYEKLFEGGWITVLITAALVGLCYATRNHYAEVSGQIRRLDESVPSPLALQRREVTGEAAGQLRAEAATALLLVGSYSGLGRKALLTLREQFPGQFQQVVFLSVAVVDSEAFKSSDHLHALEERTKAALAQYVAYAHSLGMRASSELAIGTDVGDEAERLVLAARERFPSAVTVAGQLVFPEDAWWHSVLHNSSAFQIQRRLQRYGVPVIVLPLPIGAQWGRGMASSRPLAV